MNYRLTLSIIGYRLAAAAASSILCLTFLVFEPTNRIIG
jgi:hypothetical protein